MKPTDLMIGDWVNLNFDIDYKTGKSIYAPVQVTGINKDGTVDVNLIYDKSESMQDGWDSKLIEPIPLTPEIMMKNGFELYPEETNVFYLNAGYRHDLDTVCLYIGEIERPSIYGNDSIGEEIYIVLHCKYVHEFQHVLKMCGIEKEIVL